MSLNESCGFSGHVVADLTRANPLNGHPATAPAILEARESEAPLATRSVLADSVAPLSDEQATQVLAGYLRSSDARLRNAAIELLRGMPEQVAPVISPMLIAPETEVRILAVGLLDNLRHPHVEDWLLQLIEAETDVNVGGAALEVLTTIGTTAAIGPVSSLMRRFADEPYITFAGRLLLNRLDKESH